MKVTKITCKFVQREH